MRKCGCGKRRLGEIGKIEIEERKFRGREYQLYKLANGHYEAKSGISCNSYPQTTKTRAIQRIKACIVQREQELSRGQDRRSRGTHI